MKLVKKKTSFVHTSEGPDLTKYANRTAEMFRWALGHDQYVFEWFIRADEDSFWCPQKLRMRLTDGRVLQVTTPRHTGVTSNNSVYHNGKRLSQMCTHFITDMR